jgi:hypothetical protein
MQLTHVNTIILGAALILVIAPITLRVGAPMLRGIVCCRQRVLDVALALCLPARLPALSRRLLVRSTRC